MLGMWSFVKKMASAIPIFVAARRAHCSPFDPHTGAYCYQSASFPGLGDLEVDSECYNSASDGVVEVCGRNSQVVSAFASSASRRDSCRAGPPPCSSTGRQYSGFVNRKYSSKIGIQVCAQTGFGEAAPPHHSSTPVRRSCSQEAAAALMMGFSADVS